MNAPNTPDTFYIAYDVKTPVNGSAHGAVTLYYCDQLIHSDKGDLHSDTFRDRFTKAAAKKLNSPDSTEVIEMLLLERLGELRDLGAQPKPPPRPPTVVLTQQGNAQTLVRRFGGGMRFNVSSQKWMFFDGKRWSQDLTGQVTRWAKRVARDIFALAADDNLDPKEVFKHAKDSEKASGIAAILTLATTEPGMSVTARDLDADAWLLNVQNGTVDLRTGELHPHRREDLLAKLAPVTFEPDATCPLWDAFLNRIMNGDGELIEYLQRIAGLCLTGDARVQELFVFHGQGANGKSVFLDTIGGMLGEYAGEAPPSLVTVRTHDEHPTEIADLAGMRLVIASETEEGAKLRIQLVKRLTGNARLKGRFMRCDFFEFDRTHKLILVTNNKPVIRETTNAIWRRVRLVPFGVIIPEEERDTQLLEKLRAEWPGILAWAVRGCLDYRARGMQTPAAVESATDAYRSEQDPIAEWFADRCFYSTDEKDFITRAESYPDYQEWARRAGVREPLQRNEFYEHLRKQEGVTDSYTKIKNVTTRIWSGIGLTNLGSQYQQAQQRMAGAK